MLPDLDSLALFVRAAEMKNLTRACEASLITVPAVSRRLSLLERPFKATLFERHSRGLDLTLAGEMSLVVEPLLDAWALRSMRLCTRRTGSEVAARRAAPASGTAGGLRTRRERFVAATATLQVRL